MGWFARIFNAVPKEEQDGLSLDDRKRHWEVVGKTDGPTLFRALQGFLPDGAILYFEDCCSKGDFKRFLEAASIPEQVHITYGTIWPRPSVFHVPAAPDNLEKLAELAEHCAEPEVAIHFHVYTKEEMLLQWYDAFDDPMLLSSRFSESDVSRFCAKLGMTYKEDPGGK
jgi:hypothetical protein